MDVVTTLAAAPQVTPPQAASQQTPADPPQADESSASGDAFEEEFANAASAEEASADEAAETVSDEAIATSNENLLDVEDLTETDAVTGPMEEIAPDIDAATEAVVEVEATPDIVEATETEVAAPATPDTTVEDAADAEEVVETVGAPVVDAEATEKSSEESDAEVVGTDTSSETPDVVAGADAEPVQPTPIPVVAAPVIEPAPEAIAPEAAAADDGAIEAAKAELMSLRGFERPMMKAGASRGDMHAIAMREVPAEVTFMAAQASTAETTAASSITRAASIAATPQSTGAAEQVVAAIRADAGADQIDVQLDPPELGRVRIQLNFERADTVVATVSSERGETLDLLRRHGADLTRELERAGFANVELEFSSSDSASSNGSQQEASSFDGAEADLMSEEAVLAYVRQVTGRLDRFV